MRSIHRLRSPAQPQPKFEGSELDSEHERSDCTPESGLLAFQGDDIFSVACSRFAPVLNPRARTSFCCVLDDATEEVSRSKEDRPREEVNLYTDYIARQPKFEGSELDSEQERSDCTPESGLLAFQGDDIFSRFAPVLNRILA